MVGYYWPWVFPSQEKFKLVLGERTLLNTMEKLLRGCLQAMSSQSEVEMLLSWARSVMSIQITHANALLPPHLKPAQLLFWGSDYSKRYLPPETQSWGIGIEQELSSSLPPAKKPYIRGWGEKQQLLLPCGSSKSVSSNKMSLNIMHSWPDIKIIDENIFFKMCSCKNKPMCENRVPKQQTAYSGVGCPDARSVTKFGVIWVSRFNLKYLLNAYCELGIVLANSLLGVGYIG